jgi:hypothetical protein
VSVALLSGNTSEGTRPSPSSVRVFAIYGEKASQLTVNQAEAGE